MDTPGDMHAQRRGACAAASQKGGLLRSEFIFQGAFSGSAPVPISSVSPITNPPGRPGEMGPAGEPWCRLPGQRGAQRAHRPCRPGAHSAPCGGLSRGTNPVVPTRKHRQGFASVAFPAPSPLRARARNASVTAAPGPGPRRSCVVP